MKKRISNHIPILVSLFVLISMIVAPFAVQARDGQQINQGLRVVETLEDGLVIELNTPEPALSTRAVEGSYCQELQVENSLLDGVPGQPGMAVVGTWIGIPPGAELSIRVLESQAVRLTTSLPVCPIPETVVNRDIEGNLNGTEQTTLFDQHTYTTDDFMPQNLAIVENVGSIRSQAIARLRIWPVQYNPVRSELHYYPNIRLEVTWRNSEQPLFQGKWVNEGYYEKVLQNLLINYAQAKVWRSQPQIIKVQSTPIPANQTNSYKLTINQDGIYQVDYSELQAAGVPVDTLVPRTFRLFYFNNEIPIEVIGEEDDEFNPGDYLLFHGKVQRTKYTDRSVYWLTWGDSNGIRMPKVDGTPTTATTPDFYLTTTHLEQNQSYQAGKPSGLDNDHWYYLSISATSGTSVSKEYTTQLNHVSFAPVVMEITVRGLLRSYSASPYHHTRIYLNNNLVDDATWAAGTAYSFEKKVPITYLVEGLNKFKVEATIGSGSTSQIVYVNWLEIDYADQYQAENDLLYFDGDNPGTWQFKAGGFNSNSIDLYNISDPFHPSRIVNVLIEDEGGTYRITFTQTLNQETQYLAQTPITRLHVLSIELDQPSNLQDTTNQADYLLITHSSFISETQRLADWRATQGMKVKVIDVQDIYDEFNGGIFMPEAITNFISYTYTHWVNPTPTFVLLVGDGHYDFRNFRNLNEPEFIPPYLGEFDQYFGETAADNRFVTVSGTDTIPDLMIGRLPVRTLAETAALVDKIMVYEQNPPQDDWNLETLFVADDYDPSAGDFAALSDGVIADSIPTQYNIHKVYYKITHNTDVEARSAILSEISAGRLLVSYVGHASKQWWAYEKLLQMTDLSSLTNTTRYKFMVPMTCYEGYFIQPTDQANPVVGDQSSLGESIVRLSGKGAVASWSPTGAGVASGHDVMERALFDGFFKEGLFLLGQSTNKAKTVLYAYSDIYRDLVDTYVLFGDPVTRLNSVEALKPSLLYLPLLTR
jgi:hypothetical protein